MLKVVNFDPAYLASFINITMNVMLFTELLHSHAFKPLKDNLIQLYSEQFIFKFSFVVTVISFSYSKQEINYLKTQEMNILLISGQQNRQRRIHKFSLIYSREFISVIQSVDIFQRSFQCYSLQKYASEVFSVIVCRYILAKFLVLQSVNICQRIYQCCSLQIYSRELFRVIVCRYILEKILGLQSVDIFQRVYQCCSLQIYSC